ncbi:hypothetical protein HHI36_015660 [Cryptolaemus montrouzieri]|uniref:Uncharacterized protein n=1 Tax=Cryptolaemus montrouzieri TaxID=559131 RepID=A0ABD2N7E6_9CUCU
MFEIEGKVALITGGASGIGLEAAKQILQNGARGVTIADINAEAGEKTVEALRKEFGRDKVIFTKTDVSNKESFEDAFKSTLAAFNNIDILMNNAGIFDEKNYEKLIQINMLGVTHGIVLAIQKYLINYRTGSEGVIINTASIAGTRGIQSIPIYSATKSAVVSMTMSFGNKVHYERTKVRVVAVAPGFTLTDILNDLTTKSLDENFARVMKRHGKTVKTQTVDFVGRSIIKIIKEKPSGTVWISEEGKDIEEYIPSLPLVEIE